MLLEHETGDYAQGEAYLERLLNVVGQVGPEQLMASGRVSLTVTAVARITGIPDRLEIAEAAADAVLSEPSVNPLGVLVAKVGLALLAVQKGGQFAAKQHYAFLLGQKGTMILTVISVDRLLGLLSQTMGNTDRAVNHFEDALAFCRKAGYRPELAWTCHDYAETLLQRRASGDPSKAASLVEESLSISTELGMRPLMERVTSLQERAASRPVIAPAYPDGLSQREVEVLRLVALGKTDREIAEELFVSARTVGYHVGNILNKTNSGNRTEAATYATQHGLVEPR